MQNYARSKQYPIVAIAFDFLMLDKTSAESIDEAAGRCLRGVFLEGARWDLNLDLSISRPKQLFLHFIMPLSPCKDRTEAGRDLPLPHLQGPVQARRLEYDGPLDDFVMWIEIPSNSEGGKRDGK